MDSEPNINRHARHGSATEVAGGTVIRAPGGYPVTEKMRWRTPGWLYEVLDREFGFSIDACSEDNCALAPRWITVEEDALTSDWRYTFRQRIGGEVQVVKLEPGGHSPVRAAFSNPPWSARHVPKWVAQKYPEIEWSPFPGTEAFLLRCHQMSRHGLTVAALVPQAFDAAWFKPLAKLADEIRVGGRFRFSDHLGRLGPQPPGGHCLVVYRPHTPSGGWPGGPRVDWDWRPEPLDKKP